jgi:hypothetical protein
MQRCALQRHCLRNGETQVHTYFLLLYVQVSLQCDDTIYSISVCELNYQSLTVACIATRAESGHKFENTLFTGSSSTQEREQLLLGGGAYTQYFLKIYGVALYAEAAAMAASPAMRSLRGQSADALRANGAVWQALIDADDFDKSLVLKLSLPVSSKMVVDALRNEFDLNEEQSVRAMLCAVIVVVGHCSHCTAYCVF